LEVSSAATERIVDIRELSRKTGENLILRRWAATWIDFIVLLASLAAAQFALGDERYQASLWFWVFMALAYHPVLEGLTGRTIGRRMTGTIVVNENGDTPGIPKAIVRSLLRWIEVNPFLLGGAPAGVIVLANKNRQRLGDMLAKTYVVRTSDLADLARTSSLGPEPALPMHPRTAPHAQTASSGAPTPFLVLDANCFIDAFNPASSAHAAVRRLFDLQKSGKVRIAISKHSLEQLSVKPDEAYRLARQAVLIPYYPVGSIEELLGSIRDAAGSFDDMRESARAMTLMTELAKAGADIRDEGALLDALMANADAFVTSDDGLVGDGPVRRLESHFGIRIARPDEVLA
jgi:uncharacterized RDD family membrane protein YckC